jgi:hypothetical protein
LRSSKSAHLRSRIGFVFTLVAVFALSSAAQNQPVHTLCSACHSEQVEDFLKHPHAAKALSCDACHGTSVKHRQASGGAPPDRVAGPQEVPGLCGTCHIPQKAQFDKSKHAAVLALAGRVRAPNCGTCHGVHVKNTPAQIDSRCARCHTQLPPSCKPDVRCVSCHDKHTNVRASR